MIQGIKGKLIKKGENSLVVDVGGIFYEVSCSQSLIKHLSGQIGEVVELVIYHYLNIDKNKGIPVLVGFSNDLEKDFFEKFISVSGVGPKAALKAFDKPVASIASAIEEGDTAFLKTLDGVGSQRAKQIVAHLQGKVGRFALIKDSSQSCTASLESETIEQAKEILKKLQYSSREAESMLEKALSSKKKIDTVEELLNEIYRQRK